MKEGSGSPTPINPPHPWINQRNWRIAGAVAIAGCALLAFFGGAALGPETALLFRLAYWGLFLVLMVVALYMVLLDIRYIKLQYALERRAIFQETIGDAGFRSALRETERRESEPVVSETE